MKKTHLHIERLVLDGLPVSSHQASAVQAAFETELARLLSEQGLMGLPSGAMPRLSLPALELASDTKPAHLGHQIAQAIYNGIRPTSENRAVTAPVERITAPAAKSTTDRRPACYSR